MRAERSGWEIDEQTAYAIENWGIEQAVRTMTITIAAQPPRPMSRDFFAASPVGVEAGEKKAPKRPNEANMLHGISNLTQKTNPNEPNKSFVLGVPPKNEPKRSQ